MSRIANIVINHRKLILAIFIVLAALGAVASLTVSVNYKMADYLPQDAQSTKAIDLMKDEFGGTLPNARVMLPGVSIQEALDFKEKLEAVSGVSSVTWLDDVTGRGVLSSTPVEFLDRSIIENYYKDDTALFTVTIEGGQESAAVTAIRALAGDEGAVAGDAVNSASMQELSKTEVGNAVAILLPVILVILLLTTTSWLEPLLFFAAIGVAVLINMGTNIIFGEVSFITQTVSPILQLAVSLDYAIFLLHCFSDFKKEYPPAEAMARAVKKAVTAVAASAATTVVGFTALLFMRFGIGADLGLNLVKGVILSFISVMIFLPALTLACTGLLEKTRHRRIIPTSFGRVGKALVRISTPFLILAVLLAVPSFLAQSNTNFQYGMSFSTLNNRAGADAAAIEEVFGKENALVLLVPKGDPGREADLADALGEVPHVTSVVSYTTAVGSVIPPEYLTDDVTAQFYSDNYARIILYTNMADEGEEAFATVQTVLDTAGSQYEEFWLAGQSATLYDMKTVVSTDTTVVNIAAIIGIFLILLFTFRTPVLPVLLVFTIETAIWLNLSFGYFSGQSYSFIGYLIISTVQLGSTVDYAILMTDRFLKNRQTLPKKEAMSRALGDNLEAVVISAAILSTAGFVLAATSSNMIIAQLGTLLGRGTALSFVMVALVLPALLTLFDGAIQKTSFRFKKSRGNGN